MQPGAIVGKALKFLWPSGSWVIDQINILHISINNNSRIAWPTDILIPFFSFLDNLFHDVYITFQNSA